MISRYQTEEMSALFNEDARFRYMLEVEKKVAQVQAGNGLIPKKAALDIQNKARINLKRIQEIEKQTKHDVIAFVSQVAETVGSNGRYIHYGLTSSDVLDTALSLQMKDAFDVLLKSVAALKKVLKKLAVSHQKTMCVGRTHGMYAELTTFGFKLMGFLSEITRAEKRLKMAGAQMAICKLSGAVGTSSALDLKVEAQVARQLGLKAEPFATQVIPRDRHAEVMLAISLYTTALERLAIELRHLQRTEVSEVIEGFTKGQKGSSAMPHKKNPISAENITGLSRLVRGFSHVAQENILLWHERDISHSSNERIIIGDAFTLAHYLTLRMQTLFSGLYVNKEQMQKNTLKSSGVLFSSHVLLYLIEKKGLSREKAYELVQKVSHDLNGENLMQALLNHPDTQKLIDKKTLESIFSGEKHIKAIEKRIKVYGKNLV